MRLVRRTVRSVSAALGPARFLTWSSDDGRRLETVRIVVTDRGLRASGHIVVVGRNSFGATFSILCDAQGRTRRLTVQGESALTERGLSLTRTPGGPWLDGAGKSPPLPELDLAVDVDLTASAFTNSLTIRRLGLHERMGDEWVTVAEVGVPDLAVGPIVHRYTTLAITDGGATLMHHGPAGAHEISCDREGFVVDLPHLSYRLR